MARTTVRLTFRGETLNEPVIYRMGQDYKIVTNIRRADNGQDTGWLDIEIDGEQAEIYRALDYARQRGLGVEPLRA